MKFYIVTPTYNALGWLQRCVRSVADQVCRQVEVHHHVQDGASMDGTIAWLQLWQQQHSDIPGYKLSFESIKDNGMYDAINRAWEKIPLDADITAHLNSDEQYLPGALAGLAQEFELHPDAEIAVCTYIVVDAEGRYICHRRPVRPQKWISHTVCEIITCVCFHKVAAFMRHGIRFNSRWRAIADVVFFRDIVNSSPRFLILPGLFTSIFTVTGKNLQWSSVSAEEWLQLMSEESWWWHYRHAFAYRWCHLKKIFYDKLCNPPTIYSLFLKEDKERSNCIIKKPTCYWKKRTQGE